MQVDSLYRATLLAVVIGGIVPAPARALLTFDDGHDQLFATANVGLEYDTNISANRFGQADSIISGGVGLEYTRHAGIISVDASTGLSTSRFDKFTGQDFSDPHFQGEFSAKDDRTTADLTLNASRESAADIVSGLRAVSWDYAADLNTKYQVTDRYSIGGSLGYTERDFVNPPGLVNLQSYSAGTSLFYSLNSARDFFVGYNFGLQKTSSNLSYYDHSINAGLTGKILPKLNGTVSVGYEIQDPHGTNDRSTGALTEDVALTWNFSRRLKITGDLSQGFNATSLGESVNTLASSLDAIYAMNSKTNLTAGVGGGYNRFIGAIAAGRRDTYFTWNAGATYTLNDHFTISATYTYYENWSTLSFSDFIQNTVNLSLNVRY
ncbi:MAG: outer membrane beta-barrel protein [Opitutaceae bacterium]|jgi:hypothetical protein